MNELSVFTFDVISDYYSLLANDFPLQAYNRILLQDSLFYFYPYAEFSIKDPSGILTGNLILIEGIKYSFKFGFEKRKIENREVGGYIEHNFIASELQTKRETSAEVISGSPLYIFLSEFAQNDFKRCNIYNNTVSNIVKEICTTTYHTLKNKYITDTTGIITVGQQNMQYKDFLKLLCAYAYSQSQPTECFYTFINLKNELYFTTLFDLFNKQQPVKTFYFKVSQEMTLDDTVIQDYYIQYGGFPNHQMYYNMEHVYINSSGQVIKEKKQLNQYVTQYGGQNKFTILKQSIPSTSSQEYYIGITQDKQNEKYIAQAKRNYALQNAFITYRMYVTVHFDPELVTGKLIELDIKKKTDKDILSSQEYSGKWLIAESKHYATDNNMAYSQLLLIKPVLEIDKNNPQYKNLL